MTRKALVDGIEMTPREIAEHVKQTRGYTIHHKTIAARIKAGMYGNVLISKPRSKPPVRKSPRKLYPQKMVYVNVPGWGVRVG